jgi:hypothetical protein
MRLPPTAHSSQPWRIHEITSDFRLEDVWRLPVEGGWGDFEQLVAVLTSFDPGRRLPAAARTLLNIRLKLGALFGWDRSEDGVGARVATLRDRLAADLRDGPAGPDGGAGPFTSLYMTENEWAAEAANRTMHGVLHLGWVADDAVGFRAQLAVLVKPNGLLGELYMAAIRPFRHLVVYPAIMREIDETWRRVSA